MSHQNIPLKATNLRMISNKMFPSILMDVKDAISITSSQQDKGGIDEALVKRERDILSRLYHSSIMGYYKAEQDAENYYLCLEYIRGNSLSNIINSMVTIPLKMVRYYMASMACTLNYLHSIDIIYRNLNPQDIIITAKGELMLIDFSCAK